MLWSLYWMNYHIPCTYQHVLSKPSFIAGDDHSNTQSKAFLSKQGIATITTTKGFNLAFIREVCDQNLLWVARPVVFYTTCINEWFKFCLSLVLVFRLLIKGIVDWNDSMNVAVIMKKSIHVWQLFQNLIYLYPLSLSLS